ncbi:MAG: hypothetical protein K6F75_12710 [Butyrivibrio sp.]|nr:hypothetical protein [Butyrivibrio sp.]
MKRLAIVLKIVGAILAVIVVMAVVALVRLSVRTKALQDDYSALLSDERYNDPVSVSGVEVITQDVSCGYAVIEMFSSWCGKNVTEESLYEEYGKVVTSTGKSFCDEMNKQFPEFETRIHKWQKNSELLSIIYENLAAGVPVPFEWAALYGDQWTLHYSLVIGMDIKNDVIKVANPYGYYEELSVSDFLGRTSFEAYDDLPLFMRMAFAIGIFEKNTVFSVKKIQGERESMIEDNKEVDKESFASGISTGEEMQESETDNAGQETNEAAEVVISNEIEERCPVSVQATRKDVEYGEFTHGAYYSETCGLERGYSILLPADYRVDKQYPVLYLLHGIFGDEYSFSGDAGNKIKEIVGNMAADGLIEETIVVCPNMYATTDPDQKPGFDSESVLPYDNFINDLVNDLMPFIEKEYSVLTGRENTYLAGFSMGGRETIFITLKRPELFGYVCSMSAAPGIVPTKDKFMTHTGQMQESEVKFADGAVTPNVFMLCCGTRDSVVGTYPKSYHELLEEGGVDHIWYEVTGADHDNNVIKSGLYNLFKQIAYDKAN